jgi:hypothetical protein
MTEPAMFDRQRAYVLRARAYFNLHRTPEVRQASDAATRTGGPEGAEVAADRAASFTAGVGAQAHEGRRAAVRSFAVTKAEFPQQSFVLRYADPMREALHRPRGFSLIRDRYRQINRVWA